MATNSMPKFHDIVFRHAPAHSHQHGVETSRPIEVRSDADAWLLSELRDAHVDLLGHVVLYLGSLVD